MDLLASSWSEKGHVQKQGEAHSTMEKQEMFVRTIDREKKEH